VEEVALVRMKINDAENLGMRDIAVDAETQRMLRVMIA